ncbi:MAG: hypothetical protein IPM18_17580 [Phycisphaerales bacterium]|nr:hypothetical protein [Phycisphaerales bacterium]
MNSVDRTRAALEDFELDLVACCSDAWCDVADCGVRLEYAADAPPRALRPRYIVGVGCKLPPGTPPENVRALVAVARE